MQKSICFYPFRGCFSSKQAEYEKFGLCRPNKKLFWATFGPLAICCACLPLMIILWIRFQRSLKSKRTFKCGCGYFWNSEYVIFAVLHFRMMVEPACGAALSVLYFANRLNLDFVSEDGPVVAVVCGGNLISIDLIDSWRQQFNLLWIDGVTWIKWRHINSMTSHEFDYFGISTQCLKTYCWKKIEFNYKKNFRHHTINLYFVTKMVLFKGDRP